MTLIRKAGKNDIADIIAVVNAAFEVENEFRAGPRTNAEDVARLMRSGTFLLAVHEEQVAGAVLVQINGTTGYFGMLAVWPELQRLGIGRALLEAAESFCRANGCTQMTLSTGSVRQELITRYRKLGYEVTGIERSSPEGPFSKPIDIVKMAKPL